MHLIIVCCIVGVALAIPDVSHLQYEPQQKYQPTSFYTKPQIQLQPKYQPSTYYKQPVYPTLQKYQPTTLYKQPAPQLSHKFLPPYTTGTYGYSKPVVPIIAQSSNAKSDGSFHYGYKTGDGQQVTAQGYIKNPGQGDKEIEVVQGGYDYTSPDGTPVSIRYVADEYGYRAVGTHVPKIPEAILRSLALNAAEERAQQYQSNQYYQTAQKKSYGGNFKQQPYQPNPSFSQYRF